MHFSCSKDELLHGIALVEKAVASTDTITVIKGIHIETEDDSIVLTSTNLELSIQTHVDCQVFTAGSLVLNGKLLASIVRKLPNETVIFQQKEDSDQVDITAGSVEFSIHALPDDDFPSIPTYDKQLFSLPALTLQTMIRNTVFATSQDETRPYLGGIYIELEPSSLIFAATDSNRLARYEIVLDNEPEEETAIVPAKTMTELNRSLPTEKDKVVACYKANNQLIFSFNHTLFVTRLIEGQFPNYRSVIPGQQPISITLKKQHLLAAVDRASLMDTRGSQPIVLEVTDGVLEVKTPSSEMGYAYEQLNVEHSGENGQAAFSPRFIMDMLRASDAESVTLEFNAELRPAALRPADSREHLYVLMPVRI